jgi:hypothetical protein
MPRIPIYEQQSVIGAGPGLPRASADAFGVAYADALGDVAGNVRDLEIRRQRRRDETASVEAGAKVAEFNARWGQVLTDREAAAEADAVDYTPKVLADFDREKDELLAGINNEPARLWATDRLNVRRGYVVERSLAFEASQRVSKELTDFGRALDLNRNALQDDPDQFAAIYEDTLGVVASLNLPPDKKAELARAARDGLVRSTVVGEISRDPEAALERLKSGAWNEYIDPDTKIRLTNQAEAEIAQRQAVARQEASAMRVELGNQLEDFKANLDAGVPVNPAEIERAATTARAIGRTELARGIERIGRRNDLTARLNVATPAELQSTINEMSARITAAGENVPAQLMEDRTTAEALLKAMNAGLAADPLSWAAKAGTAQVAPLDFDDADSMATRRRVGDGVAGYYGRSPKYLTNEEAAQLADRLATATPDEKAGLAQNIVAGFGTRASARVFAQLGQADPVFAHAGALSLLGPQQARTARQIFAGQELIKAGEKVLAKDATLNPRALAMQPVMRARVYAAAQAIYTAEAVRRGIGADDLDTNLWTASLNQAVGGSVGADGQLRGGFHAPGATAFVRRERQPIVLPPEMTAAEFDDLVFNATAADAKRASVGGEAPSYLNGDPVAIDKGIRGFLWDAGDGRYMVSDDRDGLEMWRGSGPGGFYVLDVRKLQAKAAIGDEP